MLGKVLPINESGMDRALRAVLGLAALSLVFWGPRSAWGWIGLVPLLTALVGSCPLYTLLGIRTCAARSEPGAP